MDKDIAKLLEDLNKLDDTEENRRKAMVIRNFLVEDAQAKVKIEEMREGVFEEILPLQLAHEAKILFDKVKKRLQKEIIKEKKIYFYFQS